MSSCCTAKCADCVTCKTGCQGYCLGGSPEAISKFCQAVAQWLSCDVPSISRDDIIIKKLPKAKVQELMTYLYNASNMGSQKKSGPQNATVNDGEFLKASDINQIMKQLRTLNDCSTRGDYARDDIIYASEINEIMNKIRNAQLDGTGAAGGAACVKCNASCDSCKTCINCA